MRHKVLAVFPGLGKTTLAKTWPGRFLDWPASKHRNYNDNFGPQKYISAGCQQARGLTTFVDLDDEVANALAIIDTGLPFMPNIDYALVMPHRSRHQELLPQLTSAEWNEQLDDIYSVAVPSRMVVLPSRMRLANYWYCDEEAFEWANCEPNPADFERNAP